MSSTTSSSETTSTSLLESELKAPTKVLAASASITPQSTYKLILLGDEHVGKTSIITRFMWGTFKPTYKVTIGIDFVARTLHLDDRAVRLQIWDTAGQERFRAMIPGYIRDSSVAVVVYDVTNRQSFVNTDVWISDVRADRGDEVLIVLVGNKTDMTERRQVPFGEGEAKAREKNCMFVETSAKAGFNVKGLFRRLAQDLPSSDSTGEKATDKAAVDVILDNYSRVDDENNAQSCSC